jgi:hypothetical protein
MNIIHGLTTGVSGIPKAGKDWENKTKIELPKQPNGKVNRRAALNILMNHLTISEILGRDLLKEKVPIADEVLNCIKPAELFTFLLMLARKAQISEEFEGLRIAEIASLISFPVEEDFAKIAGERFTAYKKYKKSPKPGLGVCEICGSAFTQKPGVEAPKGSIQCFSYVKAHPKKPRAICYLCSYDLGLVRKDVYPNYVSISLWITSKVDIGMEASLEDVISRIDSSLSNPRYLVRMVNLNENFRLPLPSKFKLPISKRASDMEAAFESHARFIRTSFGVFGYLKQIPAREFSVKNVKAAYAPLYDLLNLLGFTSCITNDLEFKYGLFGEKRVSTPESYFDAVSVLLLAKTFAEKRNPYCMAADIISSQPSLAIQRAVATDNNDYPVLTQDQLIFYLNSLLLADRELLKGGGLTMGELLREAAFFARNIPLFCVEPEDKGDFWGQLTKHKATKPVQVALSAMMRGHDFDVALSTFLAQLSDKIGKGERESLDDFVRESKQILEKYFELRQRDFSGFLKAKNALMSAIYAFTRYKDLDKTIEEGF